MGFEKSAIEIPPLEINKRLLENYGDMRDFPAAEINELTYPAPMVDHEMALERCLRA